MRILSLAGAQAGRRLSQGCWAVSQQRHVQCQCATGVVLPCKQQAAPSPEACLRVTVVRVVLCLYRCCNDVKDCSLSCTHGPPPPTSVLPTLHACSSCRISPQLASCQPGATLPTPCYISRTKSRKVSLPHPAATPALPTSCLVCVMLQGLAPTPAMAIPSSDTCSHTWAARPG
jgi:hypothetical protein